jgi:hypothetical protein
MEEEWVGELEEEMEDEGKRVENEVGVTDFEE